MGSIIFHQGRVLFQQFLTASASTRKPASIDLQRFLQRYYPMDVSDIVTILYERLGNNDRERY